MPIYYPKALAHLIWWPYLESPEQVLEIRAAFEQSQQQSVGSPDQTVRRALEQLVALSAIEPRSASVEHNDIFTADTFEIELDEYLFRVAPTDVRALMIDLRFGHTERANDALDISGDTHRQIYGHADHISQAYVVDGASTIMAKGRDYTGLLLDEKWQGRRLELGRPLTELIEEALEPVVALAPLDLVLAPGLDDPIIEAGPRRRDRFFVVSPETSLWEGLLELTMRAGLMLTVAVDRLLIQPPRNVLAEEQSELPLFIEGRNLKQLKVERNLGTADLPSVLISAYDRATRQVVTGQWPTARKVARLTKGKRSEKQTIQRFFVKVGHPTTDSLTLLAKRVFTLYARQQLEVSFTTYDMAVSRDELAAQHNARGASGVTQTTRIRNGTGVRVRFEPEVRHVLARRGTISTTRRELVAMGYEPEVADILARAWEPVEQLLYVNTATQRYGQGGEYSLSVRAQNYITV